MVDDVGEEAGIVEIDELLRIEVRREQLASGVVVDHMRGIGEVDRVGHLGVFPRRAQRDQRTPELQDGKEGDRELGTVGRHDRDRVPVRTPRCKSIRAHALLNAVEVAEAVLIVAEPNRDVLRQTIGGALEREVQTRRHSGSALVGTTPTPVVAS